MTTHTNTNANGNAMNTNADEEQPTQLQETQEASQQSYNPGRDDHIWAYMAPCSKAVNRVDFLKPEPEYRIGRNREMNNIAFTGFKISNQHAIIRWDGVESEDSSIIIIDNSSNGTFINGEKIGRGNHRILRDGQEIAFGSVKSLKPDEDYRFIFRHNAGGRPSEGFNAFYELGHELGSGSFATVVKAISRATGIWYAVKIIKDRRGAYQNGSAAEKREKMITREIEIMRRLKHPYICELKDVFLMSDGSMRLVLEFIEGGDLLDFILRNNGLNEEITQRLTFQLCLALSYMHELGIAHRDLKPENVLLDKSVPPNVKVADFGLAKAADSATRLKTMCGTPAYLAPEVVRQETDEGYDHLVDSWSIGVIVFSMLTNASPFQEDQDQKDIRSRIDQRYVEWDLLEQSDISEMAKSFIHHLLIEDPRARMTLRDGLKHPWMIDYAKKNNIDMKAATQLGVHPDLSNIPTSSSTKSKGNNTIPRPEDTGSVSQGLGNLQINSEANGSSIPGLVLHKQAEPQAPAGDDSPVLQNGATPPPPSSQGNGIQRESSRVLKRRKDVLDQAAEGDPQTVIPEPSPEMLSRFAREDERWMNEPETGPSKWGEKQAGKRVHGELSTVFEDGAKDNDVSMGSGDSEADGKLVNGALGDVPSKPTPKRQRKNFQAAEEPPRRSARHAAKKQ